MSKRRRIQNKRENSQIGIFLADESGKSLCVPGYTSLDKSPEVMTACRKIAELIGSITIHLMNNTEKGDFRIQNELSRKLDINPAPYMTRTAWMQAIVMNLLLYGCGNSIVLPHTHDGYLGSLEPIAANRVGFRPITYSDYRVQIDGVEFRPDDVLHFVHNPDSTYLWKGRGLSVSLKDVVNNLKQAAATEKGFMESKWKPSIIVKVDALTDEFASPQGRKKLLNDYIENEEAGEPWIIPAELMNIEQVKPLTLADLAINDTVQLDKRMVAAIIGVPPFLLGVGEYKKDAWNNFIQNTVRPIAIEIQQEMTKKLIVSPNWYVKFNVLSLMDWDIKTIYDVFGGLSDKGIVTGNEVRDRIGMSPMEGLDELRILENFIPSDMIGNQKKLTQNKKEGEDEQGQDETD